MKFPTLYAIRRRVRAALRRASPEQVLEGSTWYADAHAQVVAMAERQGVSVERAAGVVAAISPGLSWVRNIYHAEQVLMAARHGYLEAPPVPTYSRANVRKAWAIAKGSEPDQVLSGPKVTVFYRLLSVGGNPFDVCVDGHMVMMARGVRKELRNSAGRVEPKQLEVVAKAIRLEAERVGLQPCQAQAIAWLVQKEKETR